MIELRIPDWQDSNYDSCGNTTKAVLEINHINIPLCSHCLEEFLNSVKQFQTCDKGERK